MAEDDNSEGSAPASEVEDSTSQAGKDSQTHRNLFISLLLTALVAPAMACCATGPFARAYWYLHPEMVHFFPVEIPGLHLYNEGDLIPLATLFGAGAFGLVSLLLRPRWLPAMGLAGLGISLFAMFAAGYDGQSYLMSGLFFGGASSRAFVYAAIIGLSAMAASSTSGVRGLIMLTLVYCGIKVGAYMGSVNFEHSPLIPHQTGLFLSGVLLLLAAFLAVAYSVSRRIWHSSPETPIFSPLPYGMNLASSLLLALCLAMGWEFFTLFGHTQVSWGSPKTAVYTLVELYDLNTMLHYGRCAMNVVTIAVGLCASLLLLLCHKRDLHVSPWWIYLAGALCWSLSATLVIVFGPGPLGVLLFCIGEILVFVGAFGSIARGLHWRAVGVYIALLLGFTPLIQVLFRNQFYEMTLHGTTGLAWITLILLLISMGWGLVQLVLFRTRREA